MTNYDKIKDAMWVAAKKGDKETFDAECQKMIAKAGNDWWRIGWNINPENLDDVYNLVFNLVGSVSQSWKKAIEEGDAPPEDVSPAEGFIRILRIIDPKRYEKETEAAMVDALIDEYGK